MKGGGTIFGLSAAVLLAALSPAGVGQASAAERQGVADRWTDSVQTCDASNSKRVTLEKIRANPEAYYGHCVSIVGAWNGNRLCPDRTALARPYPSRPSVIDCIGAESWADDVESEWPMVQWVRVYGEVSNCDDFWAMAAVTDPGEGAFWEIAGYCHTNGGPDLRITARQPLINPAW